MSLVSDQYSEPSECQDSSCDVDCTTKDHVNSLPHDDQLLTVFNVKITFIQISTICLCIWYYTM